MGCPHTAIREDASMNIAAIERLESQFSDLDIVFLESGGDNLAATFSPELVDLTIYTIDVAGGDKNSPQGWPRYRQVRFISNQQDRPCAVCRSRSWHHGTRYD